MTAQPIDPIDPIDTEPGDGVRCVRRPGAVVTRCPCKACGKDRYRLKVSPPPDTLTAATERLRVYVEAGWDSWAISTAAGLPRRALEGSVTRVRRGETPKILHATRAALLALPEHPWQAPIPPHGTLPMPVGLRRGLRGLARAGHDTEAIAAVSGVTQAHVACLIAGVNERARVDTLAALEGAVERLRNRTGTSWLAAQHAEAQGWAPLSAWHGIDIRDPAERSLGNHQRADRSAARTRRRAKAKRRDPGPDPDPAPTEGRVTP